MYVPSAVAPVCMIDGRAQQYGPLRLRLTCTLYDMRQARDEILGIEPPALSNIATSKARDERRAMSIGDAARDRRCSLLSHMQRVMITFAVNTQTHKQLVMSIDAAGEERGCSSW